MRITGLFAVVYLALSAGPPAASPQEDLLNTDRAVAAYAQEHGFIAAFTKYMGENPTKLDPGVAPTLGTAAIVKLMATYPKDLSITWQPQQAVVAKDADLGVTWGQYQATYTQDGKLATEYGKYLDVWSRQADGGWKWIFDIGNGSPPPK